MGLQPITVQLSKFEQIEILRSEIEKREEELRHAERQIRETIYEMERIRYLQVVHPVFQQLPPPEAASQLPHLNALRETLHDAVETMKNTLTQLQAETAGQTAPASRFAPQRPGAAPAAGAGAGAAAAPGARRRFDSFDDFRSNKGS